MTQRPHPIRTLATAAGVVVALWLAWWVFLLIAGRSDHLEVVYVGFFLGGPLVAVVSVLVLVSAVVRAARGHRRRAAGWSLGDSNP